MKKLLDKKNITSNLIISLLCIVIIIAPLIVDYSNLPKGYEVNKVFFINAISGLILAIFSVSGVYKLVRRKKLPEIGSNDVIVFFLLVLSMCLSSVLSAHPEIAYFGNSFRFQGFYTHLLLVTTGFVVYKTLSKSHLKYILLSFIVSGFVQAIIGINQFAQIFQTDPERLQEGLWINGTFGQANWFAGRLLIAIFISYFVFLKVNVRNNYLKPLLKFGSLITLVLSISALIFSYSRWALITFGIFTILFFLLQYPKLKAKRIIFILIGIGIVFTNIYIVFVNQIFDLHSQIPREIITVLKADPARLTVGYGFDTLGEVFKDRNIFQGVLIDRAHNFFFDLIIQGGLFLFSIATFLIYSAIKRLKDVVDRYYHLFLFLALMWIFRSSIHESGIVNLLDFVLIVSILLSLSQEKKKLTTKL